jgi:cell division protease FtsH
LSYGKKDQQVFLGREITRQRDYSEQTAQQIDALMRRIIDDQHRRARTILEEHREELERLAKALLVHEMLDRSEVTRVIKGETLEEVKRTRTPPSPRGDTEKVDGEQRKEPAGGNGRDTKPGAGIATVPTDDTVPVDRGRGRIDDDQRGENESS